MKQGLLSPQDQTGTTVTETTVGLSRPASPTAADFTTNQPHQPHLGNISGAMMHLQATAVQPGRYSQPEAGVNAALGGASNASIMGGGDPGGAPSLPGTAPVGWQPLSSMETEQLLKPWTEGETVYVDMSCTSAAGAEASAHAMPRFVASASFLH